MFRFFKRKRKFYTPPPVQISIEDQLANLAEIGITLKPNIDIGDILGRAFKDYEKNPYIHLLMRMGGERERAATPIDLYSSNDVWCFDRECIEDHGDYVSPIRRIAEMVGAALSVTEIEDYVDIEAGEVWIAFNANGANRRYTIHANDDWLSLEILTIFSDLLAASGSSKRFFFSDIGNEVLVVLIEKHQYRPLNRLLNIFVPASQS
ncbi:hypothetical protein [Cohnella hashimotonis]|uniref:SMI1/KNR4 family protein n=1 Tax=Cohnella hashimotonis TaxID=2826895 RepID=A0ABT6TGP9_9BACL|nr:hypothetical protein [Cohnella hashimotonis]MDI4645890.1 hypothetical protein [Cohnella hashimotonis]